MSLSIAVDAEIADEMASSTGSAGTGGDGTPSTPGTPSAGKGKKEVLTNTMLRDVDVDLFVAYMMEAWFEQAKEDAEMCDVLCSENQVDDDPDLNLPEFAQILQKCTFGKMDDRDVLSLFKSAGVDMLGREAFTDICWYNGIVAP